MSVFALTGNLASGKSTVLRLLKKKGAIVFDADKRIHAYYRDKNSKVYQKIASEFSKALCNGFISRKKLGKIVFCDKKKLRKLEKIIHPLILKDLKRWINENRKKNKIFVAEVPLLFEKKLQKYFDATIIIYVKKDTLVKRIVKKLRLSRNKALKRLSLYLPTKEKIVKSDFIIDNSFDFKNLLTKIDLLWNEVNK